MEELTIDNITPEERKMVAEIMDASELFGMDAVRRNFDKVEDFVEIEADV